jgi:flagellar motility protein MotE (MotC chaperone)
MRSLLFLGGTGLLCCSCGIIPTANDLREIALKVDDVERVALDTTKDSGDLQEALADLGKTLDAKVEELQERGEGFVEGMSEGAEGGLIGIGSALLLNMMRNRSRKKDLDDVVKKAAPSG